MTNPPKKPSETQARMLARMWGRDATIYIPDAPIRRRRTATVIDREGWVKPTGEVGAYPDGTTFREYVISDEGLAALAAFLLAQSYERKLT